MIGFFRRALPVLLLLAASPLRADVAYVSESLNVGVHESQSLTSTILMLVSSGTRLEVLEKSGGLARVKLDDGSEGWVDARYLTDNLPASRKVSDLEAELTQTATELAKARDQIAELQYQLNREKERSSVMQSELVKARKPTGNAASTSSGAAAGSRKLGKVIEENRALQKRVAELEAHIADNGAGPVEYIGSNPGHNDSGRGGSVMSHYTAIMSWNLWQLMLLFFSLVLAFAAGGYLVDWEVRRRHGGFRV